MRQPWWWRRRCLLGALYCAATAHTIRIHIAFSASSAARKYVGVSRKRVCTWFSNICVQCTHTQGDLSMCLCAVANTHALRGHGLGPCSLGAATPECATRCTFRRSGNGCAVRWNLVAERIFHCGKFVLPLFVFLEKKTIYEIGYYKLQETIFVFFTIMKLVHPVLTYIAHRNFFFTQSSRRLNKNI